MKFSLVLIVFLLCSSAMAMPQIFSTDVTIEITNTTLKITGEQGNFSDTLVVGNGSVNSFSKKYTMLIVRDIAESKDVSIILENFLTTLNFSDKWVQCEDATKELMNNFSSIQNSYIGDISRKESDCIQITGQKDLEIQKYKSDSESYAGQRLTYAIVAGVLVFVVITVWKGGIRGFKKKEEEGQFPDRDRT